MSSVTGAEIKVEPHQEWDVTAIRKSLDELFTITTRYKSTKAYRDLLEFIRRFRAYSPFNAMLAHIQRPGATYVAPPHRWLAEYRRHIKAGANPIVMLQPMGPVMFVFDVSDTEPEKDAPRLPPEIERPFEVRRGYVGSEYDRTIENAKRDGVAVLECDAGSQHAGSIRCAKEAKNPLLLYLLVVILFQKNIDDSILQKIDLYMMATKLLLEGQSGSRKLSPIKETVAINILGKIATRMQENGSWVIHNEEVIQLLRASMAFKDDREVERFLRLIRERSGLFFRGRGNKYGFYHPTFQDYFAARYLVRDVKRKQTRSRRINQLIEKGCDLDNKWREPFILAVAYLSREDGEGVGIVNEILKKVLERASNESDKKAQESILLLAAECVIEVQPLHIDNLLMDSIVQQIKIIFTDINKDQEVERHQQITDLSHRWKRICKQDLLDP